MQLILGRRAAPLLLSDCRIVVRIEEGGALRIGRIFSIPAYSPDSPSSWCQG
jgi:hypothetical protein